MVCCKQTGLTQCQSLAVRPLRTESPALCYTWELFPRNLLGQTSRPSCKCQAKHCKVRYVDDQVRADDCSAYLAYVVVSSLRAVFATLHDFDSEFAVRAESLMQCNDLAILEGSSSGALHGLDLPDKLHSKQTGPLRQSARVCSLPSCGCTGGT